MNKPIKTTTSQEPASGLDSKTATKSWWIIACGVVITSGAVVVMLTSGPSNSTAVDLPFEIVSEHPHDALAYTQGLVFYNGRLYESTGRYGESSLREVDYQTGAILRKIDVSPDLFAEGLCLWKDRWLQLTWKAEEVLSYDRESLELVDTLTWPEQGWGLTHDGQDAYISDGTDRIFVVDPDTFDKRRTIKVTENGRAVDRINELEFIDGYLFANVWYRPYILKIDPKSGQVVGKIDFEKQVRALKLNDRDAVLNGIAYDAASKKFFLTGKLWPKLFVIRLVDEGDQE